MVTVREKLTRFRVDNFPSYDPLKLAPRSRGPRSSPPGGIDLRVI